MFQARSQSFTSFVFQELIIQVLANGQRWWGSGPRNIWWCNYLIFACDILALEPWVFYFKFRSASQLMQSIWFQVTINKSNMQVSIIYEFTRCLVIQKVSKGSGHNMEVSRDSAVAATLEILNSVFGLEWWWGLECWCISYLRSKLLDGDGDMFPPSYFRLWVKQHGWDAIEVAFGPQKFALCPHLILVMD